MVKRSSIKNQKHIKTYKALTVSNNKNNTCISADMSLYEMARDYKSLNGLKW